MKERVYEIKLAESISIPVEKAQTKFMSEVFEKAKESGILAHGLEITLVKISDGMENHPESREGEMFLTNANDEHYPSIRWKSKRRGYVAYGRDGNIIKEPNRLRPVFVQKKEYDEGMKKYREGVKEQ